MSHDVHRIVMGVVMIVLAFGLHQFLYRLFRRK
jgi:hypothetical protein